MITRFGLHRCPAVLAAAAFLFAIGCSDAAPPSPAPEPIAPLVTAEWLSDHLTDSDLVVLDCSVRMEPDGSGGVRTVSGRPDYEVGHIPTAGFADLTGGLSDAGSSLSFALPSPEAFAVAMGELGVGDDTRVVLYDRSGSVWASRVWWMLKWVGFDRAAVLDGGLPAWTAEGLPLSTEPAVREARLLTPDVRPERIATRAEVRAAIDDDAVTLIDAMPEAHYRGEMAMYGRPGHIPGAVNVPSMALVDESGRFRPPEELAALFPPDREGRVISYCGAGVAASATAFTLTRLGHGDVAVYMGSLQEWAADPANPLTTASAGAAANSRKVGGEED